MVDPPQFSKEIYVARKALLLGAQHVANLFGKSMAELEAEYKPEAGDTPRTLIDKYSEREILQTIKEIPEFQNDRFNAEETGLSGEGCRVWHIDPYDGTSNAKIRLGASTLGIGISLEGRLFASVVVNPFENKIFFAESGKGAYIAEIYRGKDKKYYETGEPRKIFVNKGVDKDPYAWIDALFNEKTSERKLNWIKKMQVAGFVKNVRMTGSNIDYSSKLAEGRGNFQLTDAVGGFFDLCGAVLIEEAGGLMVNIRGERVKYGDQLAVAVSNPADLEKVLQITQECYSGYQGFVGRDNIDLGQPLSFKEKSWRYLLTGTPTNVNELSEILRKSKIKKVDIFLGEDFDDYGIGQSGTFTCFPVIKLAKRVIKLDSGRKGPLIIPQNPMYKEVVLDVQKRGMGEIVNLALDFRKRGLEVTLAGREIEVAITEVEKYDLEERRKLISSIP